jgi:hypothetical protein
MDTMYAPRYVRGREVEVVRIEFKFLFEHIFVQCYSLYNEGDSDKAGKKNSQCSTTCIHKDIFRAMTTIKREEKVHVLVHVPSSRRSRNAKQRVCINP